MVLVPKQLSLAVMAACYLSAAVTAAEQSPFAGKLQKVDLSKQQIFQIQTGQSLLRPQAETGQVNQAINLRAEKLAFSADDGLTEALYFVRLQDQPISLYQGNIQGLKATSLSVRDQAKTKSLSPGKNSNKLFFAGKAQSAEIAPYQAYINQRQTDAIEQVQQLIGQRQISKRFSLAVNGFTLTMTAEEAKQVADLPSVAYVHQAKNYQLHSDQSSKQISADQVQSGQATGTPYKGEGIILGIIDTGVNSDHPSFADIGGDGYDHDNPFGANVYVGDCAQAEFAERCNDKLIGMRSYSVITNAHADMVPGWPTVGEDYSGHGSHVASTAAGNVLLDVDYRVPSTDPDKPDGILVQEALFDQISGIAPHANIISYQVCHSNNDKADDHPYKGCPFEALVSGIEDAIRDGVDVINFSIGGQQNNPWTDGVELAFLAAREAGISVAAAAGNSGQACGQECFGAIDHASPWLLNVAATTHDRQVEVSTQVSYAGYAQNAQGQDLGSTTPWWNNSGRIAGGKNNTTVTGVVVQAKDYPDIQGVTDENGFCGEAFAPGTFDFYPDGSPIVGAAEGQTKVIVVCARNQLNDPDGVPRTIKAENIAEGGADGFILYNQAFDDNLPIAEYILPSAHFSYDQWFGGFDSPVPEYGLEDWLNTEGEMGHQLTINPTQTKLKDVPEQGDILAAFSSRGPSFFAPEVLIPTLAAPGVNVYAAYADEQPFTDIPFTTDYNAISGTSMASPNVAGSLALLRQAHPDWSAAEVQSALMLTADDQVQFSGGLFDTNQYKASTYRAGAGRINLAKAINTGLIMHETADNFRAANPNNGGKVHTLNTPQLVNMHCKPKCQWIRTVKATKAGTWKVTHGQIVNWANAPGNQFVQNGVGLKISPSEFSLEVGQTQSIIVETEIMDTQDVLSNSEVELHSQLLLTEINEASPEIHMPVVFKYDNNGMPGKLQAELNTNKGQHLFNGLPFDTDEQVFTRVFAPTKAEVANIALPKDDDNHHPWSRFNDTPATPSQILDEATHVLAIQVPENSKRLVVESLGVISSELQGQSFDTGNLLVYLGQDYNGNGQPDPDSELLCVSNHIIENNFCNVNNPTPGNYWAILYNPGKNRSSGDDIEPEYPNLAPEVFSYSFAVVSNKIASELSAKTLTLADSKSPSLQLDWDIPQMQQQDIYYTVVDFGSSEVNAGNKGKIPLKLIRGKNDISLSASQSTAAIGDTVALRLGFLPNLSGKDRKFSVQMQLPEQGVRLTKGDIVIATDMIASYEVKNSKVTIKGTQLNSADTAPHYKITTNKEDALCRVPNFGNNDGGYVDLEKSRIFPSLSGFNLAIDEQGNQVGNNDITYANGVQLPVSNLFNGNYRSLHLYNNSQRLNVDRENEISIRGTGNIGLDNLFFFFPDHRPFPYSGFPYESLGVLWRGADGFTLDAPIMSVPLDFSGEISGISLASTTTGWGVIEYDNARSYLYDETDEGGLIKWQELDDRFDFELIINANTRFGKGEHELYMAYDNIDFGSQDARGSIGLQGFQGLMSNFGPLTGALSEQFAFNDLKDKIYSGLVVCYDYVGPESSQFEVVLNMHIQPDAAGQDLIIKAQATAEGIQDRDMQYTLKVPGHISIGSLSDIQINENQQASFKVFYADNSELQTANKISVSAKNVTAEVQGHSSGSEVILKPDSNFHGTTQVQVTVTDVENPTDKAIKHFDLVVISDGVEPGCTQKGATNYNPNANKDDGSCAFPQERKSSGGSLSSLWLTLLLPVLFTRRKYH